MVWLDGCALMNLFLPSSSLPDNEWRVFVNVFGEILCHQPGLQFDTAAILYFVIKERMRYLFAESLLKFFEEQVARLLFETVRSQFDMKVSRRKHAIVEQR